MLQNSLLHLGSDVLPVNFPPHLRIKPETHVYTLLCYWIHSVSTGGQTSRGHVSGVKCPNTKTGFYTLFQNTLDERPTRPGCAGVGRFENNLGR